MDIYNNNIEPSQLFRPEILGFEVESSLFGAVPYVNLDNAATTPPFQYVEIGVQDYLASYGSVHRGSGTKSQLSTDVYEQSRETIKRFVNAPDDYYALFTGNTTGAMNAAAYYFSFMQGKVAVSDVEHSSSWLPWVKAEGIKKIGSNQVGLDQLDQLNNKIQKFGQSQVVRYSVNGSFEFDIGQIEQIFADNDIKVLVLTASSNVTGYCPDIKAIGGIVHKHGAYFVVDACQFLQHHPIDMQEMGIDFLAASGHKFYAPYGGGFLIGPKDFFDQFISYEIGGGNLPYITKSGEFIRYSNQLAHDPGTPNAIGAVAMGLALEELERIGLLAVEEYEQNLTAQAFRALASNPKVTLYVTEEHLGTVLPFNIQGMDASVVADRLNDEFGIGVRAGSFCVYNVIRQLLGVEDDAEITDQVRAGNTSMIPGLVRASFGLCNTQSDVARFIEAIEHITREE